jgi:hypothetical protein
MKQTWAIVPKFEIHDIIKENGSFLTANELNVKYNLNCNVMDYNALKNAIPGAWRKTLKNMKVPNNTISFDEDTHQDRKKRQKC